MLRVESLELREEFDYKKSPLESGDSVFECRTRVRVLWFYYLL